LYEDDKMLSVTLGSRRKQMLHVVYLFVYRSWVWFA